MPALNRTRLMMIWAAALLLFVVHQDFWFWNDRTLLWGFFPIGLAYHSVYSIAAAGLWALAVKYAWPATIQEADTPAGDQQP